MNVEIGAGAALFSEKEYIMGIFGAMWHKNVQYCSVVVRPEYKELPLLVRAPRSCHTGDSNSCPPDLELGALLLNGWLARF
jgi:hypothetical protein